MNVIVFRTLASHWRRNPLQLFTLLAGLALATALWSGVQAVNAEARASYDAAAGTLDEANFAQLVAADGGVIAQETYVALRRGGWLVSPVIEGQVGDIRLIGIDPLTAPGGIGPVNLQAGVDVGAFLTTRGQIFAMEETLSGLVHLDVDRVTAPDVASGLAYTDIGVAQRLLDRAGEIDLLIVAPEQPIRQADLSLLAPGLIERPPQAGADVAQLTDSFHLNLSAFGLLSFAVGIFIVNGAIGLAFEQRRPMVRTVRALGVPLRRIMALIAAELIVLSVIAGVIGVGLGYVIAAALLPDVAATLNGLYGAEVAGTLQLRPSWWLSGLAIAVGGTLVAGSGAFWQLSRMPLLAAAQPRALAMAAGRRARMQGVFAAILLAIAAVLSVEADGLVLGFAFLGALLIGAALALPFYLNAVLAFGAARSRSVLGQWFWSDTRQQLPGLSLALMALLLAMAANVGVSTMVSSFRLTFVNFLDQRLASELYVSAQNREQALRIVTDLQADVAAVLPIQSIDTVIETHPTEIFGARDHATYRDNWRFVQAGDAAWDQVASGRAILINEQLFRRAGFALGDLIKLQDRSLPIVGIYGDYGNPIGQAVISETLFAELYPNVFPENFGLRIPPGEVENVRKILTEDIGVADGNIIDQAGIKAFSLEVFDRTFIVTTALNILTLAVAGFAILMSLLTLATMRVPQLAPAWAVGVTRRQLWQFEVLRAIVLAVLTAAMALPLGLLLAWALLAIVNVAAFGWELPMFLFPVDYARLGLFALVAAALAALLPARRLARTPPADLLKVFSNER